MMKQVFTASFFLLTFMVTLAQESELPGPVKTAFEKKYPGARHLDWYAENENYILEFEVGMDSYAASYDKSGSWIETGVVVADGDIPQAVTAAIKQKCPQHTISYAESMDTAKGEKFFRVHCFTEDADILFNVTANGNMISFLKKESYKEAEKEEESQ